MKKILLVGVVITIIGLSAFAAEFFKHPAAKTTLPGVFDDGQILTQLANYRQWILVKPEPVIMDPRAAAACGRAFGPNANPNPHSTRFISVYVNQPGHESMMTRREPVFPQGSIIVKEKLNDPHAKNPELLTVMLKREPGYNIESGDWEYLVLDGSASTIRARGRLEKCNACHVASKASDFVDRSYLPSEVRQKLK